MTRIVRTAISLRDRIWWVWKQDSAWFDAFLIGALIWWNCVDTFADLGVVERRAFVAAGAYFDSSTVTIYTLSTMMIHALALLARHREARIIAAFLQGVFWSSVAGTIVLLSASPDGMGLTTGLVVLAAGFAWASLFRITRRYSASA